MTEKKVILFVIPPASGHVNPSSSIACELTKNPEFHVIFLNTKSFKDTILRTNAEFIEYDDPNFDNLTKSNGKAHSPLDAFKLMITGGHLIVPQIIKICEERKPIAVIFDLMAIHARYLFNYIANNPKNITFPVPKQILIVTCFAMMDGTYPSDEERKVLFAKLPSLDELKEIDNLQNDLNNKIGLNFEFGFDKILAPSNELNICCVDEELQPKSSLMKSIYNFVGCCVNEQVRSETILNENINSILNLFDPINPNYEGLASKNNLKLIYISLGTVFNYNIELFDKILQAFYFDEEGFQMEKFRIIVSLGEELYELYQNKIKNEDYHLNRNIFLVPSAPQVDILKRASLFITHAGMNSASETIKYAVPVVCIPQFSDQPLVAKRICDELKFGITLNNSSDSRLIRDTVYQVLTDKSFLNNILNFSKKSRDQNGCLNAYNLILKYIS